MDETSKEFRRQVYCLWKSVCALWTNRVYFSPPPPQPTWGAVPSHLPHWATAPIVLLFAYVWFGARVLLSSFHSMTSTLGADAVAEVRKSRQGWQRGVRSIAELSVGLFSSTQPDPTHQITDPTQPSPLPGELMDPWPNPTQPIPNRNPVLDTKLHIYTTCIFSHICHFRPISDPTQPAGQPNPRTTLGTDKNGQPGGGLWYGMVY